MGEYPIVYILSGIQNVQQRWTASSPPKFRAQFQLEYEMLYAPASSEKIKEQKNNGKVERLKNDNPPRISGRYYEGLPDLFEIN